MSGAREVNPAAELTVRAVAAGVLLWIVFGASNAYLGLRVGLTVSASIPAAVMAVAIFSLSRRRGTILEANLAQTIGSASTALATGTIFTIALAGGLKLDSGVLPRSWLCAAAFASRTGGRESAPL